MKRIFQRCTAAAAAATAVQVRPQREREKSATVLSVVSSVKLLANHTMIAAAAATKQAH